MDVLIFIYLLGAALTLVAGCWIEVEGRPNISNVFYHIAKNDDGLRPYGELGSIFVVALLWPLALAVVLLLALAAK